MGRDSPKSEDRPTTVHCSDASEGDGLELRLRPASCMGLRDVMASPRYPPPSRPSERVPDRAEAIPFRVKMRGRDDRRHHDATMITLSVSLAAFLAPPAVVRVAKETDRRCAVLLKIGPDSKGIDAEISLAAKVDERWKFLRDNPGAEAAEAADDSKANPMQRSKDARLAERDTRRWCLDRCLSTGYCEVRLHCTRTRHAHSQGDGSA